MSSAGDRNQSAKAYVEHQLQEAHRSRNDKSFLTEFREANQILDRLIPIKANGFRGVVITALAGMHLNPQYDPLSDFYDCNPRSLFEHGIYYALAENGIPCGKSDPLNVAKNSNKLNAQWATGKRPESAAFAVIHFLELLQNNRGSPKYKRLVTLFFLRLLQYTEQVAAKNVPFSVTTTRWLSANVGNELAAFVNSCPEGGAVPQYIVGLLVSMLRDRDSRYKIVAGYNKSVFGTNTTGNKPADIWEVRDDDRYGKLYEVTVKPVDMKRLDDCAQTLRAQGLQNQEVIFICNVPKDVLTLHLTNMTIVRSGLTFQFLDIQSFIRSAFALLDYESQKDFIQRLQHFVFDTNRPVATKTYWSEHFVNI